jgi:N-acetylglutamate synthase-like GNAT family acetyltransferase
MGGLGSNPSVSSPFGPVRAGLTSTHIRVTQTGSDVQQLTELLNSLEKEVAILVSRSYEVLDTYLSDTSYLAEPTDIACATVGIDINYRK